MEVYDKLGKPIDMETWDRLRGDMAYSRVGADKVGNVEVSTVWLGMNHAWQPGHILIFETMVFGGPLDGEMSRYATEAEAQSGHAAMLALVYASQIRPTEVTA